MQWSLVQYVGYQKAKELGNMHENETPNAPDGERNMDLWNNAIGREIALEINKNPNYDLYDDETKSDIAARKIYERMQKGDLITNPNDKRKFENMELERLTEADRVYSNGEFASFKENVTTMVMDKYLDYIFSNNMERPTEENLNKRVLSGELIYVENYERADGTRVHGYYRRKPVK